jgi:S-adenosylmethionine:tRNA ribosyltransferase-isomerase
MLTREFDYELPESSIAQEPAPRGESRLLALDAHGAARHRRVRDLPALLSPGDLVVVNDTRVIPARLFGRRQDADAGGGRIELLLVERLAEREWEVLARPGRRARPGVRIELAPGLEALVLGRGAEGRFRIRFSEPIEPHLERLGHVPLPPYIRRPDSAADRERYQTVFAEHPGAIAAPTAGLHFSRELLADLGRRGIGVARLTLHVGIGTFQPVTAERPEQHRIAGERYTVPAATAAAIARTRAAGGRIVAVGTTVVRALESAALAAGSGDGNGDGDGDGDGPTAASGDAAASGPAGGSGAAAARPGPDAARGSGAGPDPGLAGSGVTELFITPGFQFRVVDVLLTNFHLPRSTLLMLVAAFAGRERVLAAYHEALQEGYRFYSYGDAMLAGRGSSRPRLARPPNSAARPSST